MDPIHGATILQSDFTEPDMPERLRAELGGDADLVLSDMAPNTTGHASTDHIRIVALAEMALDFAPSDPAPGWCFRCEGFSGWFRETHPGRAEAKFCQCSPRQAASQSEGVQRTLRGRHWIPWSIP